MEIRKADAAFRGVVFVLLGMAVGAGGLLLGFFDRYKTTLADWVLADRAARTPFVFVAFAVMLVAPLVATAAYLASLGRRTIGSGEYPPPGFRVIRDTPVTRGPAAHARGRVLQGISVFLAAAAVAIGLLLWRLASLFAARLG